MEQTRKVYKHIVSEPRRLVGVTVVSAHCCTNCVLEDMKVAVQSEKEKQVLGRFINANESYITASRCSFGLLHELERLSEVLFSGDELREVETLIEELYIKLNCLPDTICTFFAEN